MNATDPQDPLKDPFIEDVRQRRRELFEACGNDLDRLIEAIQRLQGQHPDLLVAPRKRLPAGMMR